MGSNYCWYSGSCEKLNMELCNSLVAISQLCCCLADNCSYRKWWWPLLTWRKFVRIVTTFVVAAFRWVHSVISCNKYKTEQWYSTVQYRRCSLCHQLHWLPIRQRILFKTAMLVYKCRRGMAPSYLSTYCMPTSSHDGRCHLCSAASGQLSVPRTTTNYGDRSFAVSGPTMWNTLPAALRLDMSLSVFRTRLKTFLMT